MYLAVHDARVPETPMQLKKYFYSVDLISEFLERRTNDSSSPIIIILDCCRREFAPTRLHNPMPAMMGGWVMMRDSHNIAIIYSTGEQQLALDSWTGGNYSPFT